MEINNFDLHIVKDELYDPDIMEAILRDAESYPKSELQKLRNYKKSRVQGNCVKVIYNFGKGCEKNQLGRLYAGSKGLQAFPHDIRDPLLERFYWNIDLMNCHFFIMIKLGREWNVNVDNIIYYCNHRNECLKQVSNDRKLAKLSFLKVAYGGNVKLHDEFMDNDIEPDGDLTLLKKVEIETKLLMNECYNRHEEYHNLVKKKPNKLASLFALILQTEERNCILVLDEFLKSKNRNVGILIHDAVGVKKLDNELIFPEQLLRDGEKTILEKTGHKVILENKTFEHNFKFKQESIPIIDDQYAAKTFINLMDKNIVRDGNDIYYFNESTGMWSSKNEDFRIAVKNCHDKLIFRDKESGKIMNYGGFNMRINDMKTMIPALIEDTQFITKNIDTSIGKLLFKDGIYDFKTNNFTKRFDQNIIFLKRIDRNFPEDRNEDLIKLVHKILFIDAFDFEDELESGLYLKKVICMGLFGDYLRKTYFFASGEPNSGKGLLCTALRSSFEEYIAEYDANNLLYNPKNNNDEERKLSWLKDLIGVRLAFSNECRISNTGLDGNLIKSIASGGDIKKARNLYESAKNFIHKTTMFLLANDVPSFSPADQGINDRAKFIRYKLKFVPEPTINEQLANNERLADPEIKLKFQTDEYKDALFYVMVDTYNSLTVSERTMGGKVTIPKCVLLETKTWIQDENVVFLEKLNEKYEVTNNPDDYIETSKIITYLTENCGLHFSATKIGIILNKLIKLDMKDKFIGHKRCKIGIHEIL